MLCRLVDPLERIGRDKEFLDKIAFLGANRTGKQRIALALDAYSVLVPLLLDRHREDFYEIIAIATGKPVEVIESQPVYMTVNDTRDCVQDGILSFFPSSGSSGAGR